MLECKKCKEFREEKYFKKTKKRYAGVEKVYYWTTTCKICLGIVQLRKPYKKRDVKEVNKLSKECLDFLKEMNRKRFYFDLLDTFRLAHYFTETFGYKDLTSMNMQDEMEYMLVRLLKIKKNFYDKTI